MKKLKQILLLIILVVLFSVTKAQVVYTDPAIPTADETVTVYFNATGTNLEGYNGDVYAHTGITIGSAKWQHVIGTWNVNSTQPQLTHISNDLYKLEITPTIRSFYSADPGDDITEMCFVFRNAQSNAQTIPDIFIEVYEVGINISLVSPASQPYFVNPGESILISAESTEAQTITLYVDGIIITSVNGNSLNHTITASAVEDSKHWIKVVAASGGLQDADSTYYYVRGANLVETLPAGVQDGINYIDESTVTLVLHAPQKNSVYVFGDFSDWQIGPEFKLKRTYSDPANPSTRYWVTLSNMNPGEEYGFQYLIDEELVVADAYADKILDPNNDPYIDEATYPNLKPYPVGKTSHIVSVFQTNQPDYLWQVTNFEPPANTDLVIYELLMRDFLDDHSFASLLDTIPYFAKLGINAIELMPVNEFEGNLSWGYNPSFYFAPDKYYGPKDDMKAFVDACHENGIAVIMDMVLNHAYGQNVFARMYWDETNNRPAANNPWFNAVCPHPPYCWGNDFNHQSLFTQAFVDRVTEYWLTEFKVDGYRFDYTKGFTNSNSGGSYDPARISVIKRMSDEIWEVNSNAYVILEHWCDNSEEKELANYGCMIWGNVNYNYNEATMGWNANSNFTGVSYKARGYNEPHLVAYMESHDEERLMAKNINYGNMTPDYTYNIKDTLVALDRMELAGAFYFTVPGPKMIWEFGELGYDYYINYPGEIGGDDHRLDNKPIRWDYLHNIHRRDLFNTWSYLINLKQDYDAFRTTDYTMAVNGAMKRIHLNHSSMNVTILGNFDVETGDIVPNFQHSGYWYDYLSGDSLDVVSATDPISLAAGEFRIYTDVKLILPDWALGVSDHAINNLNSLSVYPNPSSGNVTVSFNLNQRSGVRITIYDLEGRVINKLADSEFQSGKTTITWHSDKENGQLVNPGFYLCEVVVDGISQIQKIIIH